MSVTVDATPDLPPSMKTSVPAFGCALQSAPAPCHGPVPPAQIASARDCCVRVAAATTAAGLATLRELGSSAYERLGKLTDRLATGLHEAAGDRPIQVSSVRGLVTPFFTADPVRNFDGASACDLDAYGRFCRALLDRGVYAPASQFEAWFVSLAHDGAAIDRTVEAAAEAFDAAFE